MTHGTKWILGLWLLGGCIGGPDPTQVELGLRTAVSVAHITSLGLAAAEGLDSGCGDPVTVCGTFPCEQEVTLELDEDCPVPLLGPGDGTITVTVAFSAADTARVDYAAQGVSIGGSPLVAVSAADLEAFRSDEGILYIDYSSSEVDVFDQSIAGIQAADWEVRVDTAGTPEDASDDSLTLSGRQEDIETTNINTFRAESVVVERSCDRNPIAGSGDLSDTGLLSLGSWDVAFHAECDGRADLGSGSATRPVALGLGD
jgi:hypothetical protein